MTTEHKTKSVADEIGSSLEALARLAERAPEMDVELEKALALKRIEATRHSMFVWPYRALPRQAFEALMREALLSLAPRDAEAFVQAIAPLLSLRQADYVTDVRFGEWIAVGGDGVVELGLFSDIMGRPDLQLRWDGNCWRPFWRDDDSWHTEDAGGDDLAAFLTECLDWTHFNVYVFDSNGIRR